MLAGGGASLVLRFADRIVRIPRHPFVAERFRVAAALCAAVRDRLPVAIPDARAAGPDGMECHAALPGRMPGRGDAGPALAADVAEFLAALHAVPPATACRAGVVPRFWAGFLDLAQRELAPDELDDAMRRAFALARTTDEALPPVLVHHDLHPANLLVAGDPARLSGVIDFADVSLDDPHWDFRHLTDLGPGFLAAVLDAYAARTGRRLSAARIGRLRASREGIDRAKRLLLRRSAGIAGCAAASQSAS